ncbi:hypothetical protein L1887_62045 [Cichorium endivia]|nr:hypothetical protein L1887_62045 [Cichorium endivia]
MAISSPRPHASAQQAQPKSLLSLAETQLNGVSSRKVDDFSVVVHDANVEETAGMLEAAKAAAKPFEDRLQRSIHHLITDDHKREQDLKHARSADILHARATTRAARTRKHAALGGGGAGSREVVLSTAALRRRQKQNEKLVAGLVAVVAALTAVAGAGAAAGGRGAVARKVTEAAAVVAAAAAARATEGAASAATSGASAGNVAVLAALVALTTGTAGRRGGVGGAVTALRFTTSVFGGNGVSNSGVVDEERERRVMSEAESWCWDRETRSQGLTVAVG